MLRLNPALLRDLEQYLRKQSAQQSTLTNQQIIDLIIEDQNQPEGIQSESRKSPNQSRTPETSEPPPVDQRLVIDSLKRVLLLFQTDNDACFASADYDELKSYFTLTRGAIVETPVVKAEAAPSAALDFPVPTFVRVPAGEFLMGTTSEEVEAFLKNKETQAWAKEWQKHGYFKWEQPRHPVTLDEFQIGKYPLTNAEYQAFVKDTQHQAPSHWSGENFIEELAAHPVVNISWEDADAYCKWLTEKLHAVKQLLESETIRLPTEAEWEKAASWDDSRKEKRIWPWGNEWDKAKCNSAESGIGKTTPVGQYSPAGDSLCGAADMAGNVWEWCADWFDENYYQKSPDKNPTGLDSGNRVLCVAGRGTSTGRTRAARIATATNRTEETTTWDFVAPGVW